MRVHLQQPSPTRRWRQHHTSQRNQRSPVWAFRAELVWARSSNHLTTAWGAATPPAGRPKTTVKTKHLRNQTRRFGGHGQEPLRPWSQSYGQSSRDGVAIWTRAWLTEALKEDGCCSYPQLHEPFLLWFSTQTSGHIRQQLHMDPVYFWYWWEQQSSRKGWKKEEQTRQEVHQLQELEPLLPEDCLPPIPV